MEKKVYIKDESFDPIYKEVSKGFYAKTRMLPSLLFFSGMFVFATQVLLPILVFKTHDESIELLDNSTVLGRAAGFYNFQFDELKELSQKENVFENTQVLGTSNENGATNVPDYF